VAPFLALSFAAAIAGCAPSASAAAVQPSASTERISFKRYSDARIAIVEYPVPTPHSDPYGIALGSDGALWFTEPDAGKIGRIATTGSVTEYAVPASLQSYYIAPGPDGALWFTAWNSSLTINDIGRITTGGRISLTRVPTAMAEPTGIVAGRDGAMWFAEYLGEKIGRITTTGHVTEYLLPGSAPGPSDIAVGADGALWFTEYNGNAIGRITTSGGITTFLLPHKRLPMYITEGPRGDVWFGLFGSGKALIGRMDISGGVYYRRLGATHEASGLAQGPDGALWFAAFQHIGRLVPGCCLFEYALPSGAQSQQIVAGPDGAMWFTDQQGYIGRISVP
jgi:virginiamycin B lyase